jgi:hypothetical protein
MPPANISRTATRRPGCFDRAPVIGALAALLLAAPAPALAQKVRITNLSDVDFGTIANLQADSRRSQNICLYSNGTAGGYSVVATGSGPGSGFSLSSGPSLLAYDVEWSGQSGQASGAALSPNVALTGQTSSATQQFCNSGPPSSASLIVVLRGAELSRARQGNYSGTLTLLIAAE